MKQIKKLMALLTATMLLVVACTAPGSSAKETADTVNVVFQNLEAKTTTVSSGSVDPILVADVYFQYKAENVSAVVTKPVVKAYSGAVFNVIPEGNVGF